MALGLSFQYPPEWREATLEILTPPGSERWQIYLSNQIPQKENSITHLTGKKSNSLLQTMSPMFFATK